MIAAFGARAPRVGALGLWLALLLAGCAPTPPRPDPAAGAVVITPASLAEACLVPAEVLVPPRARVEARLRVLLNERGEVSAVHGTTTGGGPGVQAAYVAAASRCVFTPALRDGTAVPGIVELNHTWDGDTRPLGLMRCFDPPYPRAARREGAEGTTLLGIENPGDAAQPPRATVLKTSGSAVLDAAARQAAERCLAAPAVRAEMRPGVRYAQAMQWRLEPADEPDARGRHREPGATRAPTTP